MTSNPYDRDRDAFVSTAKLDEARIVRGVGQASTEGTSRMTLLKSSPADLEQALREHFEAWARSYGQNVKRRGIMHVYENPSTQALWAAYRRGAMLILESAAQ